MPKFWHRTAVAVLWQKIYGLVNTADSGSIAIPAVITANP
jgi:hypothetical protein